MASASRRRATTRARGSGPRASTASATTRSTSARATRARELDQPRAVAQVALERPPHLEREPALADAGWTRQRHEPVLAQERDQLGQLTLAVDERRRGRRQLAAARRCDGDGGDRRVMRQDRLLETP